jgi:hypothetical protein
MSRGIGTRQRLVLAAMAKLERERGEAGAYVWQIINAAGELGLTEEAIARKARKDEAFRQMVLEVEAAAAAGDKRAQEWIAGWRGLKAIGAAMPREFWGGAPKMRIPEDADIINPSRTLALLEQRGLIVRRAVCGRGAGACLTPNGRLIGQQALEDLANASPTPVEAA